MKSEKLTPGGLYRNQAHRNPGYRNPAYLIWLALILAVLTLPVRADVADSLARIKPGVVGVGTVHPTRAPRAQLRGTGFVVADGTYVATCAHVVEQAMDVPGKETLAIFVGRGRDTQIRAARIVKLNRDQDLALLKIDGAPLTPLKLGDATTAREGWQLYLTGYPLGPVLGLYPMTHRAGLAAIVPLVTPLANTGRLTPQQIRLARDPIPVFMLDAVAYPGHSGSPVWRPETGEVLGIVNAVFVKGAKETALTAPSGITYAMPANHLAEMIERYAR